MKVGDIVLHKCGGPKLLIYEEAINWTVTVPGHTHVGWHCKWWSNGDFRKGKFADNEITIYEVGLPLAKDDKMP